MKNIKLLLGSAITASIIFTGCGDDTKETTPTAHKTVEQTTQVEATKQDIAVEKSKEAITAITKVVTSKIDEAKKVIEEQTPEVTKTVANAKKTVSKTIETVKAKIHEATAPAIDASILYRVCAGCHGADASKKALGKSAVIKGWDTTKIETALNGYKNGTYGGVMKGVMKGQVSKLSSDDIKALATHISKF